MKSTQRDIDVTVIGAGGQTGIPLIEELANRGARVRAVVHRPGRRSWPAGVDEVAAALEAPAGLAGAVAGARTVHYIPPVFSPREEEFGADVLTACAAAGVPRLVYHSVLHAESPDMPHHWRKFRVEQALRATRLDWTILRPAMYSQTPLSFLDRARATLSVGFDPERPFTPVDLNDLARAAARVLLEDGHAERSYDLAGSERLTFAEMAAAMSRVWGHPVRVRRVPATLVAVVAARRFGRRSVPLTRAMLRHYDASGLVGPDTDLRRLLGGETTRFEEVMARTTG